MIFCIFEIMSISVQHPSEIYNTLNIHRQSHWELHLKILPNFFQKIVRGTKYFSYILITICKGGENYYQVQCQLSIDGSQIYTFSRGVCFLKDSSTSQCLFIIIRMSVWHFLENFPLKPVRKRFSIIKMFLKNFAKLTESYICRRLYFNKVKGCKLKRDSGAGVYL